MGQTMVACYGCGALVPDVDGPTHRYLGASAGCWAYHGEVLARGYADYRLADDRMVLVNSYAVQHPGKPSPQSIQSVGAHLIGLLLVLEQGADRPRAIDAVRRAADGSAHFRWLEPPGFHYDATILDVYHAADPAAHARAVEAMGRATWAAWRPHHPQVRAWAAELGLV